MHGESFILNDEHDNGKVPGIRCQENHNGEMRMILSFLEPDTWNLTPSAFET